MGRIQVQKTRMKTNTCFGYNALHFSIPQNTLSTIQIAGWVEQISQDPYLEQDKVSPELYLHKQQSETQQSMENHFFKFI